MQPLRGRRRVRRCRLPPRRNRHRGWRGVDRVARPSEDRLDGRARTRRAQETAPRSAVAASSIATDGDKVWITFESTRDVVRFDAAHRAGSSAVRRCPADRHVAAGSAGLWIAMQEVSREPAILHRFARTARVGRHDPGDRGRRGARPPAEASIWVALETRGRILRIGADGEPEEHAFLFGATPRALAYGRGTSLGGVVGNDTAARIHPRTEDGRLIDVDSRPAGIELSAAVRADHAADAPTACWSPIRRAGSPVWRSWLDVAGNPMWMAAQGKSVFRHERLGQPWLDRCSALTRALPAALSRRRLGACTALGSLHRSTPGELKARRDAERRGEPFLVYRDGDGMQRLLCSTRARDGGRSAASPRATSRSPGTRRSPARTPTSSAAARSGRSSTTAAPGTAPSSTGSALHGSRVLHHGDVIAVGRTQIEYCAPLPDGVGSTVAAGRPGAPRLSPAQRRVLVALCRPFAESRFAAPPSNRELAAALPVSVETVKFHLHALFSLFGLDALPQHRKRATLARQALEQGVVDPRRPPRGLGGGGTTPFALTAGGGRTIAYPPIGRRSSCRIPAGHPHGRLGHAHQPPDAVADRRIARRRRGADGPHLAGPRGAALQRGRPFSLGVASGDPTPGGFVLWTRLLPQGSALDGSAMTQEPYGVRYEIAADPDFRQIVRRGTQEALWEESHTVHAEITGLPPRPLVLVPLQVGHGDQRRRPDPYGAGARRDAGRHFASRSRRARTSAAATTAPRESSPRRTSTSSCTSATTSTRTSTRGTFVEARLARGFRRRSCSRSRTTARAMPSTSATRSCSRPIARLPWLSTWDDHEVEDNYAGLDHEPGGAARRRQGAPRRGVPRLLGAPAALALAQAGRREHADLPAPALGRPGDVPRDRHAPVPRRPERPTSNARPVDRDLASGYCNGADRPGAPACSATSSGPGSTTARQATRTTRPGTSSPTRSASPRGRADSQGRA